MDYDTLRQDSPETISMEQFYKMAHISKRNAKSLLENGVVPCEDNGKRTRRFQIRLSDAIAFLERWEAGELGKDIPVGAFSSSVSRDIPEQEYLDSEELAAYLLTLWQDAPDMLTVKQEAALCGYAPTSINHWVQNKRLDAVLYFGATILFPRDRWQCFLHHSTGKVLPCCPHYTRN